MFRSLFIGFLILSALTSKGAGAQMIKSDLDISADMLLEFFNSVSVRGSKTAEFAVVQTKRPVTAYASYENNGADAQQNGIMQFSPAALLGQGCRNDCVLQGETVFQKPFHYTDTRFFFCVSGLSPPNS